MKGGKVNCHSNCKENLCSGVDSNKMLYCFVRLNFNWISLSLNQAQNHGDLMYKFTVILCSESNENTEIHVGIIYISDTWKDHV